MDMKRMAPWLIASAAIMLALPWLAVTFIKGDGGMAACFALFFAVNPAYAITAGACAGRDVRGLWASPIAAALLFLAGVWLIFDGGDPAFLLYGAAYLLIGCAAMLASFLICRGRRGK